MNRKLVIMISVSFAAVALAAGIIVVSIFGSKKDDTGKATPDQATVATPDEAVIAPYVPETTDASAAAGTDDSEAAETDAAAEDAPADETTAEPEPETAAQPDAGAAATVSAPEELTQLLAENGNTPQELYDRGCRQLITVNSQGSSAVIDYYVVEADQWVYREDMNCSGYVGSNGVTSDMHEGGYASPRGLYTVGEAFYIYDKPQTGLATFEITPDTYWVDDPDSKYYNQRVEGTADQDWNSAEHMIECSPAYDYGFVVNYNTAAEYNKGSAIFFHISSNPTAGCIGTSQEMVLRYLAALDASQDPCILIL